jgi:O-antigen ligase
MSKGNIKNASKYERISLFVTGIFLGLVFSKGGSPVIFADKIVPPVNIYEFIFQSYPFEWFYWILGVVVLVNLFKFEWSLTPRNIWVLLPLFWFIWQVISSLNTVDSRLTSYTLFHFFACVLCYFIGFFRGKNFLSYSFHLYAGILLGFLWVLGNGLEQHFGGLESIRKNFEQSLQSFPPEQRLLMDTYEFRVKIMSNRIFSTFVYPNALAGGLLLLTPTMFYVLYKNNRSERLVLKFLAYAILGLSLICLYWSGSKAGLVVVALTVALFAFKNWNLPKKYKILISLILIIGVSGVFAIKYADYFHRGAKALEQGLIIGKPQEK